MARELSCNLGIAGNYLSEIAQQLYRIGWVESTSGTNGGFRLLVCLEDISLLDVMREIESGVYINRCLEMDTYCSRNAAAIYLVHRLYMEVKS